MRLGDITNEIKKKVRTIYRKSTMMKVVHEAKVPNPVKAEKEDDSGEGSGGEKEKKDFKDTRKEQRKKEKKNKKQDELIANKHN